jgi:hypothetical protein
LSSEIGGGGGAGMASEVLDDEEVVPDHQEYLADPTKGVPARRGA